MADIDTTPIVSRLATPGDIPQLAALRWEYYLEDFPVRSGASEKSFTEACSTSFRQSFASGQWTCWIAEDNGRVIAHAFVNVIDSVPWPHRLRRRFGYLTNLYTRPAYRDRGIGTRLLQRVKA